MPRRFLNFCTRLGLDPLVPLLQEALTDNGRERFSRSIRLCEKNMWKTMVMCDYLG
jgi:hypothetical protein